MNILHSLGVKAKLATAFAAVIFLSLVAMDSSYLNWNYHDPELAVTGTILHGFEFAFVRLAPIAFLFSVIGIVITYKKDK